MSANPVRFGHSERRNERGASMLEFAIVAPLLAILCFGVIEMAMLFNHANELSAATRSATRVAASTLAAPTDDYFTLQALKADNAALNKRSIRKVVIYKSVDASGTVPAGCPLTGASSSAPACNVYSGTDIYLSSLALAATGKGNHWPANGRLQQGVPFIGVAVEAEHKWVTRMFPTKTLNDRYVLRMEPGGAQSATGTGTGGGVGVTTSTTRYQFGEASQVGGGSTGGQNT